MTTVQGVPPKPVKESEPLILGSESVRHLIIVAVGWVLLALFVSWFAFFWFYVGLQLVSESHRVALLALVPVFVLGAKGSQWAWRNRRWDSVEHFKSVQRTWAKWGLVVWVLSALVLLSAIIYGDFYSDFYSFSHSEVYSLGVSKLQNSPVAASILGTPITVGNPTPTLISVPLTGTAPERASLKLPASRSKAAGTVSFEAINQTRKMKEEKHG